MDEVRYRSVVFATSLLPDFEIMEQGDQVRDLTAASRAAHGISIVHL